MAEILLDLVFGIVLVIFFQTLYNGLVWKNKSNLKWLWLSLIVIVTSAIAFLGFYWVNQINRLAYIGEVIKWFDRIILMVISYLPYKKILLWFGVPFIAAWIYFGIKAVIKYFVIKNNFNKQNSQQKDIKKSLKLRELFHNKSKPELPIPIEFEDQVLSKIRYHSPLGLQRALDKAKKGGLQLGKTDDGYIAVYADEEARKKLVLILDGFNIDAKSINSAPAVVTMKQTRIESESFKEKMKGVKDK